MLDLIFIAISLFTFTFLVGIGIALVRKDIAELKEIINELNNK